MAFEGLSERLQEAFRKLKSKGKIDASDVKAAMREVRMALLEADVNYKVVKSFIDAVTERAIGQEVLESITPGQQVVKIVHDEMIHLMGDNETKLNLAPSPPTIIMIVGLQGSGKTTTIAKLARRLAAQGRHPLLVAADIYRPAAVKQLQVLGQQVQTPVFALDNAKPLKIVQKALIQAHNNGQDIILIDTAGRLAVDEELMGELREIKAAANPHEILLVVDAMTGQDAVNVAEKFHQDLELSGVILTKLDGDTRGGAALSVKAVTGCPIKFVGMGEKMDALDPFHPERMVSRILGMGDILSLVEKAQQNFDENKAREMEKKIRQMEFTLDDFLEQMQQVKKMGPLEDLLGMIPGMDKQTKHLQGEIDPKEMAHIEAIIQSMTQQERHDPTILNGSRKKRIANGSGTRVQDVNRLIKQFDETRRMMKQMSDMTSNKKGRKAFPGMGGMKFPF